jgi:iron complex outermembrane receptor protein
MSLSAQEVGGKTSYSIKAQALETALEEFSRVHGLSFVAAGNITANKLASPVFGEFTLDEALKHLLEGTGLIAHPSSTGAIILKLEDVSSKLEENRKISNVKADIQRPATEVINVFGRTSNDGVSDIPQGISVFNSTSFDISLSSSVGDVLRLVPTAISAGSSTDMFADDYLFRGFRAEQSTNGLGFTRSDHPTDLANVERIEVLKGPAAVLYGQMEPGGTVNIVTKQPLSTFQAQGNIEYGSHNSKRGAIDITGALTDNVNARINVAHQSSDSHIDFLKSERLFIAPNISIQFSEQTNLTLEGSYSKNKWTALNGGTPLRGSILDNSNGDYSDSFNLAFSDSTTERDSGQLNLRLTHALNDNFEARTSYSFTRNKADWTEYAPFGLDGDDRTLSRIVFAGKDTSINDHQVIVDVNGEFETASLQHNIVFGIDYRESDLHRPTQFLFIDAIDIFEPVYDTDSLANGILVRDSILKQEDQSVSFFLQDRIAINKQLNVTAGLRYIDSELSQETIDQLSNESSIDELNESNWIAQLGVVYDLSDSASVYASRSEAFVPQQGTVSGGKPIEAEESTQYESGLRFNVDRLKFTIAGFFITKDKIAISDPLNVDFQVAEGKARSKGIELSAGGYINSNWYVSSAYGYTDTEILRSDNDNLEGKSFANIPMHTASIQTRYDLQSVAGLSVGGTINYTDERPGDSDNSFMLPSYLRADMGIYYQLSDEVKLDFLLENMFDEEYFSPGSFSDVVREPGRSVRASLKYVF